MRQKFIASYKVIYALISACYDPLLKSVYKSVPDKRNKFYKKLYTYVYLQLRSNFKSQEVITRTHLMSQKSLRLNSSWEGIVQTYKPVLYRG